MKTMIDSMSKEEKEFLFFDLAKEMDRSIIIEALERKVNLEVHTALEKAAKADSAFVNALALHVMEPSKLKNNKTLEVIVERIMNYINPQNACKFEQKFISRYSGDAGK